jgi:hypothetical protein
MRRVDLQHLGRDGRDDLDVARLELSAQRRELLVLEVVLDRERLECALLDRAALLSLFEQGLERYFGDRAQFSSLPLLRVNVLRKFAFSGAAVPLRREHTDTAATRHLRNRINAPRAACIPGRRLGRRRPRDTISSGWRRGTPRSRAW